MTPHIRWAGFATAALVITVDQMSKAWALGALKVEGASQALSPWLSATLVLNRSNAFGLVPVAGELSRWGLAAGNLAVAAGLAWWIWRAARRPALTIGAGFLIGGALGNAIDRVRLGVVVDFLDLSRFGFGWVFNVADASVDAGIALLALGLLLRAPEQPASEGSR